MFLAKGSGLAILKAEHTQEKIAEIFDISIGSVNEIINKFKNLHLHDSEKDFKPFIYNIWNIPKADKARVM